MTDPRNDDRSQARSEAAALLGVDIEHLSPADGLRVDMVSALRLVIDHEQSCILSGGSADLGKLNVAVQSLIALLPGRELPEPESQRDERDATVAPLLKLFRHLHESVHTLSAENARLRAGVKGRGLTEDPAPTRAADDIAPPNEWQARLAGKEHSDVPTLVESVPAPANVVPLPRPNPPAASAAPHSIAR